MGGESSKEKFFTTKKGIKVKKMVINPSDPNIEEIESDTEQDYIIKASARSKKSKQASSREPMNKADLSNTRNAGMFQAQSMPQNMQPVAYQPSDRVQMLENPQFVGINNNNNSDERKFLPEPKLMPIQNVAPNQFFMPKRLPPIDFQKIQTINHLPQQSLMPIHRQSQVIVLSPRRF